MFLRKKVTRYSLKMDMVMFISIARDGFVLTLLAQKFLIFNPTDTR